MHFSENLWNNKMPKESKVKVPIPSKILFFLENGALGTNLSSLMETQLISTQTI